MSKNYYDPRNIQRMTRNANRRNQDFERWKKRHDKRRAQEQEEQKLAMEEMSSAADSLQIVIQSLPLAADRMINELKTVSDNSLLTETAPGTPVYMDNSGNWRPATPDNEVIGYVDQEGNIVTQGPSRSGWKYVVAWDPASKEVNPEPKPPRIEPSPFSLIEVDDEN